jgi:hypothetical protein
MKRVVTNFISSCVVCQQAKLDRSNCLGQLQPVSVPEGAWQTISMDFVTGLPRSGNVDCILVIVDKFMKFGHFLPLKHSYTTYSVARLFMDHVYKLHGLPTAIILDKDTVFTSNFWKELFKLSQVQLYMSTSYHP